MVGAGQGQVEESTQNFCTLLLQDCGRTGWTGWVVRRAKRAMTDDMNERRPRSTMTGYVGVSAALSQCAGRGAGGLTIDRKGCL